ncbi:MAG: hypothetical protein HYY49_07745 [Ignavibacteriales bacterium]|nr:hypothetical protein [Ignavibacteriales bacterium]
MELLSGLSNTPLPTILCVAGVLFLLLSISGGLTGKITVPYTKQTTSAIIGGVLLTVGIAIYLVPKKSPEVSTVSSTTAENTKNDQTPPQKDADNGTSTTTIEPLSKTQNEQQKTVAVIHTPKKSSKILGSDVSTTKPKVPVNLKTYDWKEYGISFAVPSDLIIKSNTSEEFTAEGDLFTLRIKPWRDASVTNPIDVARTALDITPGTNKKVDTERELANLNGLKGYVAYATTTQDDRLVHMYISGFINLSNETNFTAQLLWFDSTPEENSLHAQTAIKILQSFASIATPEKSYSAVNWKKMTWDAYGIDFKIPVDFKEITSDNTQFTGHTGSVALSIKPFKDINITDPLKVAQKALDTSPGTQKKVLLQKDLNNLNGFRGYFAYAKADFEGEDSHLLVAGFLNPANETNFIVQLIYMNGTESQNSANMNVCVQLLATFKPSPK